MQKRKVSFRILSLVSLVFLAQCCCCIIPVGYQTSQNNPVVEQVKDQVEFIFQEAASTINQLAVTFR